MKTVGNDRQKPPSLSLSQFFYRKGKQYDIIRNKNDIGITVISETKIYDREHINNDRNSWKRYFEKR